jgi:putative endonuclease
MKVWVYILECADGRYYVGTYRGEDMDVRVSEHYAGTYPDAWTYTRRPVTLAWAEHYPNADQAIAIERKLKGWSRAKKEAVIRDDWRGLPALSERGSHRGR